MNVHTPERQPGESHDAYKARRRQSHDINARNGRPEDWHPEPRIPGSMALSPTLYALLSGYPLPRLRKRKSRKTRAAA